MKEAEMLNLTAIEVTPDELLLDPNNPRFSKHPKERTPEHRFADQDIQEETLRRMNEEYDIKSLQESIKSKGFVPVDNIFVRRLPGHDDKFLVVEGNRRVTSIKLLLAKHEKDERKGDKLSDDILNTLQKFTVFDLTENSQDEIDFILGLRHHGSIMAWDLLPSSFNIFQRYMDLYADRNGEEPDADNFKYDAKLTKHIAELYSIKPVTVRDKVRAYRAYLSLVEFADSADKFEKKFSIIHDTVKDPTLREYFEFDTTYCIFNDDGADHFVKLVVGDPDEDKPPAIKAAAAAGGYSLRDFKYVVQNGTEADVERVVEDREAPGDVKSDIQSKVKERSLPQSLETALAELKKIKLSEDFEGLAPSDVEMVEEMESILKKMKQLRE